MGSFGVAAAEFFATICHDSIFFYENNFCPAIMCFQNIFSEKTRPPPLPLQIKWTAIIIKNLSNYVFLFPVFDAFQNYFFSYTVTLFMKGLLEVFFSAKRLKSQTPSRVLSICL